MGFRTKILMSAYGVMTVVLLMFTVSANMSPVPEPPPISLTTNRLYHPDPDSFMVNFSGYLWPTDASKKITSSFAEYRSTHFHGGIDISTGGTVGHRIFSVQEGYVYRVRITPNGYGKMLYVRHPDGFISTYAHLKSFSDRIDSAAVREQYRTGQYEIDLFPAADELPVRRGEVVAYSGDTGFGPPHLHFEIRDTHLNPVNPLLGNSFRMNDNIPPTIYRLMARPLTAGSTVNEHARPRLFTRFARRNGAYRLGEKIRIEGKIGFGVETRDRSNGVGGRTGVHSIELTVDDKTVFRSALNALPILKTKQIMLHYDLPMIRDGMGRFQKLYVDQGNELPFYDPGPGSGGVIDADSLGEGEHELTVRCTDIYGNRSVLTGTLVVNHPPVLELLETDADRIRVLNRGRAELRTIRVEGKKQFAPGWTRHTVGSERFGISGDTLTVPVDNRKYDILKIVAETVKGSRSAPMFHVRKKEPGPAHTIFIDTEVLGDDLVITLTSAGVFTGSPEVVLSEGMRSVAVPMTAFDVSGFRGTYPLPARNGYRRTIAAKAEVNGREVNAEKGLSLYSVPADHAGSMFLGEDGLSISYDSGAVFRPLHFTVTRESHGERTVYVFEPRDILLNRGIRVSVPGDRPDPGAKTAAYFRSDKGWSFEGRENPAAPGTYEANLTSTLGEVTLLEDSTPPTIGSLRVRVTGGRPLVTFRYNDNLSGVAFEQSSMTIDDSIIVPEIDGERRRVSYQGRDRLPRGKHTLRIAFADRIGNRTEIVRNFTVR